MSTVEVSREDIIKRLEKTIARDPNAVAAMYAPDAVRYDPTAPQGMKGRDAIRNYQETLAKAFKDVEARTLSVLSKSDITAWEWVFTLTNGGPLELPTGTLAPTNRRVTMNGATFYRFNREGLIAEQRDYFDVAGLMQQLGVKL
jgi:ketosteroid isomerase-like protein